MDGFDVVVAAVVGSTVAITLLSLSQRVGQFFSVYREAGRYHIDFGRQHSERDTRR